MPNRTVFKIVLSMLAAASAAAQHVNVAMRAATTLTVTASGSPPTTQTLPVGPLAPSGSLVAAGVFNTARMQWATATGSTQASASWDHLLPLQASAGPHDVLMEWTSTAPVTVDFEVSHILDGQVGSTVPQVAVDIGDDGFYEIFAGSSFASTYPQLTLGTQPLPVRVRFSGGAYVNSYFAMRALPSNNMQIATFDVGCVTSTTTVLPTFQNSGVVALSYLPPINAPSVLVAGLAPQPVVLPPLTVAPCLLLPRQDVLLPFFTTFEIPIAIPAAVRPVELWLQRAGLAAGGQPFTAEAFRVRAF